MTYLTFHLIFTLPPILVLLALRRRPWTRADRWTAAALPLLALIYTTPWDNMLIQKGVWSYGPDQVIGTTGYVPIEEYAFFLLQPILTGRRLSHVTDRSKWNGPRRWPVR